MKYKINKEKECFASQTKWWSEHKFKKDAILELQNIANSWKRNGGYVIKFNKSELIVSENNDNAIYIFTILKQINNS